MAEENSSAAGSSSRAQRNIKEQHRRMHMKDLISQLASLIPSNSKLSMPEILDEATSYITHLQKNKESLERRRALLKEEDHSEPTVMNITTSGSTLEVNLICGSNRNFMFHEIISVLEEGAAEIINVTQFNSGDRVIFSVLSKVSPENFDGVGKSLYFQSCREIGY
ncbi:hypothetical protein CICLE_v10017474mg [Citrus x clementina]|uniref:BHLH domain-containing protein n=1 Tax=Citrus clementina TaxID=85681 RepID=V4U647_CITCL|nr:hypothetical protein CICLE_v10017474mg [Citrus x clementina]